MRKIKVLGLTLACSLLLVACGTDKPKTENSATNETIAVPEKNESKENVYFDGETLKIEMATVKILSAEVLPIDADNYRDNEQIAFVFEVTNDSDEPLDGSLAWIVCMSAFQETENTVGNLEVGSTPADDKFEEYRGGEFDDLKPGGKQSYVIAYELNDTTTPVVLKATQGMDGKELGEKTFNLE